MIEPSNQALSPISPSTSTSSSSPSTATKTSLSPFSSSFSSSSFSPLQSPPLPSSSNQSHLMRNREPCQVTHRHSLGSDSVNFSDLPIELLIEIFNWLPSFKLSSDRLNTCYVCRSWSTPAQSVLWKELWLESCESVIGLSKSINFKPQLAKLPRRLRFATSDPDYLATLDADAVFDALSKLEKLERFEVLVPYAMGDLYDSLCEDLTNSPIKEVVLGADEGIGRRHVQASMRFPQLRYLELIRLGPLDDLITLDEEWTYPTSLSELVLIQPDLTGEELRFLLSHTKNTLKKLRIDYGHCLPEESTQLEQDDLKLALVESGSQLKLIEIRWPNCNNPFLNDALKSFHELEQLIILGPICEPDKVAQDSGMNLKRLVFDLKPNTMPNIGFIELSLKDHKQDTIGFTRLRDYFLKTAYSDQEINWDTSVPLLEPLLTHEDQQGRAEMGLSLSLNKPMQGMEKDDAAPKNQTSVKSLWRDECIQEWKIIQDRFKKSGVDFQADFF